MFSAAIFHSFVAAAATQFHQLLHFFMQMKIIKKIPRGIIVCMRSDEGFFLSLSKDCKEAEIGHWSETAAAAQFALGSRFSLRRGIDDAMCMLRVCFFRAVASSVET